MDDVVRTVFLLLRTIKPNANSVKAESNSEFFVLTYPNKLSDDIG